MIVKEGINPNVLLLQYNCILLKGECSEISSYIAYITTLLEGNYGAINYYEYQFPQVPSEDILNNAPIFGRNIFCIKGVTEECYSYVIKLVQRSEKQHYHIIFCADILAKDSAIKNNFINSDNKLLIEVSRSLQQKIVDELKKYDLNYESSIIVVIVANIINNDSYIESEINKIFLYFGKEKIATENIKQYFSAKLSAFDVNKICDTFLIKNYGKYISHVNNIGIENPIMLVIRSLLKGVHSILLMKRKLSFKKISFKDVAQEIGGNCYYNYKIISVYEKLWTVKELSRALEKLLQIEAGYKTDNNLEKVKYFLMNIAL